MALSAAVASAVSPLWSRAQTAYEFKNFKQGLVVTDSSTAPGAPVVEQPTPSPQPTVRLSTASVNFGDVPTNTTETRQVLVSNTGTGALSFTAAPAVTGDPAFAAGLTTCGATLAAGADCLTDATFSPTAVGAYNGVLKFTSVLASSPHEVTLVGTAFNPVSLASTSLPRAMVGQAYSYDFKQLLSVSNETSPDKSLATWSGSGTLPANLSFNTTTGVLSGTPSAPNAGATYTITSTYKNNQGQQVYVIKVGEVALEVVQIEAGSNHTCAVTTAGAAKCWGQGGSYQLGNGGSSNSSIPVQVTGLASDVTQISAGGTHTCAVQGGAAKCWGTNNYGQLGNGNTNNASVAVQVTGLTASVSQVAAGNGFTCAIHSGAAKCWGNATLGKLGNSGATGTSYTAVQVTGLTSQVSSITAGFNHACAVHNGAAKCWGYNGSTGMLGNGSTVDSNAPVQVSGLTAGVTTVAIAQYHACAVHNGVAKCWGTNSSGELGNGSTTSSSVPVQVSGLSANVSDISTGSSHTCAIALDGVAKCWGYNTFGNLGDNTTSPRTSPVNVKP